MRVILVLASLLPVSSVIAQCAKPAFSVGETGCSGENLVISNETSGSYSYAWDFCSGDLATTPLVTAKLVSNDFYRARSIRLLQEDGNWFAFAISATGNFLMRLDFGKDLKSNPVLYNLGNIQGALSSSFSFDVVRVNGLWHIFVANGGARNVLRLSFVDGITRLPTVSVLETPLVFENAAPNFIRIVDDGASYYGFVSVGSSLSDSKIVRLNLGASLLNISPQVSEFPVSGSSQLRGLSFVKECNEWIGFALSTNTNTLYRLDFDQSLDNTPSSTSPDLGSIILNTPVNIELRKEGAIYYAFIQNARVEESNAALYRITFGESVKGEIERSEKIQAPELTGGAYALDIVGDSSSWYAFTFNLASKSLLRMDFSGNCAASAPVYLGNEPPLIHYAVEGDYRITLDMKDAEGNTESISKLVSISSLSAPDVAFESDNICVNHDITFSATGALDQVLGYEWNFGDGNGSSNPNPTHQYQVPGVFQTSLAVKAQNGCKNVAFREVSVFDQPTSSFTLPSDLLCTNNAFTFTTTTSDIYNGHLAYQWFVDNTFVSTARDLNHTFTTTGSKTIKLITSIPGCSDESSQTTSPVHAGPVVDFVHVGTCEDEPFTFTSQLSEPVESLSWNFGEGYTVNTPEATFTFSSFGDLNVSLTATNSVGCVNTTTRTISVNSKPLVDFHVQGPPNACAGTPTRLENLTVSPDNSVIEEWHWLFADPVQLQTSAVRDPEYTWSSPGTHRVALTALSETGCHGIVEKDVLINPSPSTTFAQTPACLDVPAVFTGPTGSDIASWYWEIGSSFYTRQELTHTFRSSGNHELLLSVTGTNGCIATHESTVNVPVPLQPDFSVSKNCAGEDALLTDITTGEDPVVAWGWTLEGGEMFDASAINYTFNNIGHTTVALKVTTAAGCSYSQTKEVEIVASPLASFLASPASGAYPLQVDFHNTSVGATAYFWQFNDGSGFTTTETDPTFSFEEEGTFDVVLTAVNEQHCSSTFVEHISTAAPVPDVNIELISLAPNADGSTKLIITLHNRGNTVLNDLPIDLDFSGVLSLRQTLDATVAPGDKYNYVVTPGILNLDVLQYVCVLLRLENDVSPAGNRACKELSSGLHIFPAYPNPTVSAFNLEWIDPGAGVVQISLTDAAGRRVLVHEAESRPGLNRMSLTTSGLQNGLYLLVTEKEGVRHVQRVAVSDGP